jgi:hypothetical protein
VQSEPRASEVGVTTQVEGEGPARATSIVSHDAGGPSDERAGGWRVSRVTAGDRDWLRLERVVPGVAPGQAWARFHPEVEASIAARIGATAASSAPPPAGADASRVGRLTEGLFACAGITAQCQSHRLPLVLWLGGVIRERLAVSPTIVLGPGDRAERARTVAAHGAALEAITARFGVRAFTIHDEHSDVRVIARGVEALREAAGTDTALTLRLHGQLSVADARALQQRLRPVHLLALADPCASLGMSVEATRDGLPALGLSAHRYDRRALLHCMATAPPALLIIDPLLEGGPTAVRDLAGIARVLQVDVSLTAETGGAWLADLSAVLAAVLLASHQPVQLPIGWTSDDLCACGIQDGRREVPASFPLAPPDGDATPAPGGQPSPGIARP